MHELALTREIVAIAAEHARGARVKRVVVEIGAGAAVLADSVRFCFDAVTAETPLAGASLEIVAQPGDAVRVKELELV